MTYPFITDLCESSLIPSKTSLKRWDAKKLSQLAYMYFLGLHILLSNPSSKQWARDYCKKAGSPNDFKTWSTSANDLYVMLYALSGDTDDDLDTKQDKKAISQLHIAPIPIRHWFRHISTHDDKQDTHSLFMRLDAMFNISDSSLRSMRRIIIDWNQADIRERQDVLQKLIQRMHTLAPSNSDLLPQLKKLKIADDDEDDITESATSGSTSVANVATVVGGLGAGFDPDGDRGIYNKSKKKPLILRR